MGHSTMKATPIVGTRQPRRLAVKAWPSSCSTFTTPSAIAYQANPSRLSVSTNCAAKASHCRPTCSTPKASAPSVSPRKPALQNSPATPCQRVSQRSGRTSGTRKNR